MYELEKRVGREILGERGYEKARGTLDEYDPHMAELRTFVDNINPE